jgi:putative transposase
MGRARRIDIEGGWYHVMNRGVARQDTFLCDADRVEFGRLLGIGHERHGVLIHAYCLMGNHFHLLLECPNAALSEFMHGLASVYVRRLNDRVGRDGPLFRGRFHSIPITDDRQLLATVRYIHRNPLDIADVTSADQYRWSSHRTYLGHRRSPPWLRTHTVLDIAGLDPIGFHRFIADEVVTDRVAAVGNIDPSVVARTTDMVLDELGDTLRSARQNVARTVLLLVAAQLSPEDAAALLGYLGFTTPERSRTALRRAGRRATADPTLGPVVDRVLALAVHDVPGTS